MTKKSFAATLAVVGLGYVGLPLAVAFGRLFRTIGYDLSAEKIAQYRRFNDPTNEVTSRELRAATLLEVTTDAARLADADFIIVAVPTPVDAAHKPDFGSLVGASAAVGKHMKRGVTVIFESTVYPGATEEICIPILERESRFKWRVDFHVGYSPERINPGDKEHSLARVVKVVSGDDARTLDRVARLYDAVIAAGVHRASSIRVAEAAKVIENTQRDLNIALMNEFAIIFDRLGIDTLEVLQAAGTKWNFLPFRPGLVGGHCIGVDPYYLTHKAEMTGYHPQVILAGRRINDGMGKFISEKVFKLISRARRSASSIKVNVLGLAFKENCPDLRNSKVVDLISELDGYGAKVFVHDPVTDPAEARNEYGIDLLPWNKLPVADAMIVAVAHREFAARPLAHYLKKIVPNGCFVDVKAMFDRNKLTHAGLRVWRL